MKQKFLITFSVLTLILALPSCKKYLDINKNPNAAVTLDPKLLFSYAVTSYVNLRPSGDMGLPLNLAGQTMADGFNNPTGWSGGGLNEAEYRIDPLIYGNPWRAYYTSIGNNLQQAIQLAEAATPKNNNAAAQCKVMLALVYYELTTLYGDVPFSEAFRSDVTYPKFDPQQKVLSGVVSTLDGALAQFDEASTVKIADYDLFYKGNIAQWKKLAKSLKLRTYMVMVDKDPSVATKIGEMITAGGMVAAAADNFFIPFQDIQQKKNPKYDIGERFNGKINFFFAIKWVTDYMDPMNDPRLPKFYDKPATAARYVGIEQGTDGDDKLHPRVSTTLQSAAQPEVIYTYEDQLFYEAEVYARGLGVPQDIAKANTLLKSAVNASCLFYKVDATTATNFSAALPNYVGATGPTSVLYNIHYQHWLDMFDRGIDPFTEWRRSGPEGQEIPAFTIPVGAPSNGLFRRYEYPITNEINQNPNAPKVTIKYYEKMWFDL
ncbi:SusD/RagB family nutrient-binding outer membrane lipoprotein [Mucilaginibacter antarcticus]|uniref:SusD/RagB family nutrient-binding outer membrane lipoprotein n=1 Tax=Mucilaginibacter antarcticus TaxID=1855725 RepID=A0ABW5XL89_9SPHI